MRPARKGPENVRAAAPVLHPASRFNEAGPQGAGKRGAQLRQEPQRTVASMRPARKGPENDDIRAVARLAPQASMRPARKGPENATRQAGGRASTPGFNEAGPQGAGKRPAHAGDGRAHRAGFNEAGPQGAGKQATRTPFRSRSCRFNEAGPQGAGKHDAFHECAQCAQASMRPARKGPENGAGVRCAGCRAR